MKHRRLLKPLALFALAALLLAVAASTSRAFPEPAIVTRTWEFTFTHGNLQAVPVKDTAGVVRWYWYLPYKVVNNTREERLFVPDITIATDEGALIQAGKDVPANVFAQIKQRLNNRLLEDPVQVVGRVLIGEDNARESVIIWPATARTPGQFRILITGLSGESQVVLNPATGQPVKLVKTLVIDYDLPGRTPTPQDQPVAFKGDRWVMRETEALNSEPKMAKPAAAMTQP